ncbi:RING finger domain-containing protein [Blastomyces gilchristii SLH14081]|uniref:RING finger domain-containing protein n=1 Tax=Blastomyces gilchristii (strain SLH14081) TaxID=559298 RepID=A0A179UUH3_BLAGS|nr:RING finger domain-containing protein [Blastomyces gilchristii SLH14081]OAT11480.1 RING finger domain-containing protein [Blastomyces gilchristii SLH14081]
MHILPSSLAEVVMPLLWICAFTLLSMPAQAQVSRPTNDSVDTFLPITKYELLTMQLTLGPIGLLPLSTALRRLFRSLLESRFNITGTLVIIDANNATRLNGSDIALVSCDASVSSGESDVDDALRLAITGAFTPNAIILYSTESSHCSYSPGALNWPPFMNIFTITSSLAASELTTALLSGGRAVGESIIIPSMDMGSSRPGSGGQRNNDLSVAMIILYSITGIITALFLTVIITGAVRAHLNPDRYGPRNTAGRPRQSRAKGIARAMLETLPIVKFGDPEDERAPTAKQDLELASNYPDGEHDHRRSDARTDGVTTPKTRQVDQHQQQLQPVAPQQERTATSATVASTSHVVANTVKEQDEGVIGPASPELNPVNQDQLADSGTLGCPICTDDFVKGQDVRLLPCQHKFHPECVDPWLINVSGTCPLCRINLNPEEAEPEPDVAATPTSTPSRATTPTPPSTLARHSGHSHHHFRTSYARRYRRVSTYFVPASTRGMILDTGTENDSAEQEHQRQRRLYTLRHMRGSSEQHRTNDGNNNVTATGAITEASSSPAVAEGSGQGQMDEASRRNRLSTWLRERVPGADEEAWGE